MPQDVITESEDRAVLGKIQFSGSSEWVSSLRWERQVTAVCETYVRDTMGTSLCVDNVWFWNSGESSELEM